MWKLFGRIVIIKNDDIGAADQTVANNIVDRESCCKSSLFLNWSSQEQSKRYANREP